MNSGDLPHYLLDTNIISEIVKFAPDFKVIKKIGEHSSDMAISVLTWHELVYGLERLPEGLRKKELSKYVLCMIQSVILFFSQSSQRYCYPKQQKRLRGGP